MDYQTQTGKTQYGISPLPVKLQPEEDNLRAEQQKLKPGKRFGDDYYEEQLAEISEKLENIRKLLAATPGDGMKFFPTWKEPSLNKKLRSLNEKPRKPYRNWMPARSPMPKRNDCQED